MLGERGDETCQHNERYQERKHAGTHAQRNARFLLQTISGNNRIGYQGIGSHDAAQQKRCPGGIVQQPDAHAKGEEEGNEAGEQTIDDEPRFVFLHTLHVHFQGGEEHNVVVDGDILLNLDSEEEGELYIGCAGGEDLTAVLEYKEVETDPADIALKVTLKGLRGGHSGLEINEGRANANKLMARFMNQVITYDEACLVSWQGGNMRNAIPRECEVVITVPAEEEADVLEFVQECEALWNEEYHVHETPISFKAERVELPAMMVPDEIKDNLVDAIYACQNGVMRMIPTIPDTVETSSNLAIVSIGGGKAEIKILARSSRDSMKDYLNTALESCFSMAGMEVTRSGGYSGWEPNVDSPILKAMKESYKAQFGTEPAVKVIHAGLECGIIGAVVPGLDMISFGPTLRSPHSPDERCFIPSVGKFYDFVVATLENTPVKE